MKCIKNLKTGSIIRVDDKQAHQMVGNTWQYIPKSEWKAATREIPKKEVVEESATIAEKQRNRKKNKK
jgi:hypothetical protein